MVLTPEFRNWYATKWQSIAASIGCSFAGFTLTIAGATNPNFAAQFVLFASGAIVARSGKFALGIADRQNQNLERFDQVCEVHQQKGSASLMETFYKSLPMIQTSAVIDVPILPALPPAQPLYDWQKIHSQVHTLILGGTGSGKSTLATWLASQIEGDRIVIDPHASPGDWAGLPVIGAGRNYQAIADQMTKLLAQMDARYKKRSAGQKNFPELVVIVDEYPAIAASDECKEISKLWLKKLAREARKVSIKLIILTQGSEVKALGVEGEGSLRECFNFVRLGKLATTHAKTLKDSALLESLTQSTRPCMIDECMAVLPDLSNYQLPALPPVDMGIDRPLPPSTNSDPELNESLVNRLNHLYSLEIQDSDSDSIVAIDTTQDADLRVRIADLKQTGLNQNQIILAIWQSKAGGNKAYKDALAEYRRLS